MTIQDLGIGKEDYFHIYNVVLESKETDVRLAAYGIAKPNASFHISHLGPQIRGEGIIQSTEELESLVLQYGKRSRFDVPQGLPHYCDGRIPDGITLKGNKGYIIIYNRSDLTELQRKWMVKLFQTQ